VKRQFDYYGTSFSAILIHAVDDFSCLCREFIDPQDRPIERCDCGRFCVLHYRDKAKTEQELVDHDE